MAMSTQLFIENCSLIKLMEWSAEAQMAHKVTRGSN